MVSYQHPLFSILYVSSDLTFYIFYLSIYLSILFSSMYLPILLFIIYVSTYPPFHLCIYLSFFPSMYLSILFFIYLSIYPSIFVSYLYITPFKSLSKINLSSFLYAFVHDRSVKNGWDDYYSEFVNTGLLTKDKSLMKI